MPKYKSSDTSIPEHWTRRPIAWLSVILSVTVGVASLAGFTTFFQASNDQKDSALSSIKAEQTKLFNQYTEILYKNSYIVEQMNRLQAIALMQTNTTDTANGMAIAELSGQVSNVVSRIGRLEDAIQASPDKALAIPMMKKDIETIEHKQTDSKTDIEGEIGRLYEFNKWFFGLIALMALSNAGLAFSAARGGKDKGTKEDAPEI